MKTCALSRDAITTMGGLRLLPDLTVDEICLSEAAMLILPGGDGWLQLQHEMILEKAAAFLAAETPVAAICAATVALGRVGLLTTIAIQVLIWSFCAWWAVKRTAGRRCMSSSRL